MNFYEAMYILNSTLSEEDTESAIESLKSDITSGNGEVVQVEKMGKRQLAYQIKKMTEGYYLLMYFKILPREVSNLNSKYRLNPSLLRWLIIKRKEDEVDLRKEEEGEAETGKEGNESKSSDEAER